MSRTSPAFATVSAEGLVKRFGATRALVGVDVTLRSGEALVIEGPNGSGKSTLLGILARLVPATRGIVRYGERPANKWAAAALRRHIGVLAHAAMVYPDLTAAENLELFAALFEVPNARDAVRRMRERCEIGRFGERPARTYSRGQLQRLALARTLLPAPTLLLLDEPSTGLDARATDRLVTAVEEEKVRGAIVAVVTHDRDLAARLADRRLGLMRGRVAEAAA